MPQRTTQQQRFVAERVRALALIFLTRREDLIVTEEGADIGVDLWVTLNLEEKEGHRKFGVELRGSFAAVRSDHLNKTLDSSMKRMMRFGPFPFPVVLFCFTMEKNEGWYTWVAEPVVSRDGEFGLVQHGKASCRPLNTKAIDQIVEAVDCWYDAFFAKAVHGKPRK